MSNIYFATPDALLGWLKTLAADYRVIAPRQEGPAVLFRPQGTDELQNLDTLLKRATASPKEAVLPKSETLVRFTATKNPDDSAKLDMALEAVCDAPATILFGGRPCDARGFVVLDRPYLQGKYQDPYYKARREATVIVTQACTAARTGCFCTSVGSNPADKEGSDILFTPVEGGFALEAITGKGKELLSASSFKDGADTTEAAQKVHDQALASLPTPCIPQNTQDAVAARFTDEPFWIKQTVKCLACGACTYLCPTCQCFTITDEGSALDGKRLRSWDSCMTSQFTLEASGHNPRNDKAKRMRQRISHKFSYYPASYDGQYSCVGCGRCVVSCPASLDIREVTAGAAQGYVPPAQSAKPKEEPVAKPAKDTPAKAKTEKSSKKSAAKEKS